MNDSIKHIIPLFFILLFSLNGLISVCPTISAKLAKIAKIELINNLETNESEKNAEEENDPKVKEPFLKNNSDYNIANTHFTVTKKSIAINNLAWKEDVIMAVIIPPPKLV